MVVDEQGRLFGRFNLIDLAVGLLCLGLVPLAYGAYVLFRTPTPRMIAIEPSALVQPENARVVIRGTDLRPFLRVRIGSNETPFLVESPIAGEVRVPALPPGVYDVSLYDEANEVARLPGALTISAPPLARPPAPPGAGTFVQIVGEFPALSPEQAKHLTAGANLLEGTPPSMAQVVAVRAPEAAVVRIKTASGVLERPVSDRVRVTGILRVRCAVVGDECKVGDTTVAVNTTLSLPVGGASASFRVDRVGAPNEPPLFSPDVVRRMATIAVRFWTFPEVEPLITTGAVDGDSRLSDVGSLRRPAAQLLAFKKSGEFDAQTAVDASGPNLLGQVQMYAVTQRLVAIEASLAVPAERVVDGWAYKGQTLRVGSPFAFEGSLYTMRGWILRVNMSNEAPARVLRSRRRG